MARKSVDFSQSLLQFQRANKKRAERPDSQDEEIGFQGSDGNIKKSKYDKSIGDEMNVESIRSKYIMQNKSLAKTNALMLVKMSDMESKISELISENMRLRNARPIRDLSLKKELEDQMAHIEFSLFQKFNDILQLLKRIRSTEGLAVNSNLDILSDSSNYSKEEPENSISLIQTPIQYEEDIKENNLLANNISSLPETSQIMSSTPISSSQMTSDSISEEPELKTVTNNNIIDINVDKLKNRIVKEKEASNNESNQIRSKNIFLDEPKLRFKTPSMFDVYQDEKKIEFSGPKSANTKKKIQKSKIKTQENNTLEEKEVIEAGNRRRSSRNTRQVNYAVPSLRGKMRRESAKPLDAVGSDVLINYVVNQKEASVKSEIINSQEKETNIKESRLNNKSNSKENEHPKETNAEESEPLRETKKVKSNRKPLATVNKINQVNGKSTKKAKSIDHISDHYNDGNDKKDDLSIFDFLEDENSTKNVYGGKRALSRRRRRHSMLM